MTTREQYMAALSTFPLLTGDVAVLLTGDGESRVGVAAELVNRGAAPLVLITGGLDAPPYAVPADKLMPKVMGRGVGPGHILLDTTAMNTREQAVNTVALAVSRGWRRLLLVASPEHIYRAHLTFVQALAESDKSAEILVVPVPCPLPWWYTPPGQAVPRIELLGEEFARCDRYAHHVASWEEGLEYLRAWEAKIAA